MLRTASSSVGPTGSHSSINAECSSSNSLGSSPGRIAVSANAPCFTACEGILPRSDMERSALHAHTNHPKLWEITTGARDRHYRGFVMHPDTGQRRRRQPISKPSEHQHVATTARRFILFSSARHPSGSAGGVLPGCEPKFGLDVKEAGFDRAGPPKSPQ